MKAELITAKTNLLNFIDKCLHIEGHTVYISEKGSSSIYSRVDSLWFEEDKIFIDTFEAVPSDNIDDVILFSFEAEALPYDIRACLHSISKTNKEYSKLENIERYSKLTLLVDCEGTPYQLDEDDYDWDRFENIMNFMAIATWTKLKDKEFPL